MRCKTLSRAVALAAFVLWSCADPNARSDCEADFNVAIPGYGPASCRAGIVKFHADFLAVRDPDPRGRIPLGLAVQQVDALITELK